MCAGNRRKEQNVIRKTKGFAWGPAAVSTAIIIGVAMRHILKKARPRQGARYICMEGADDLPNGCYGTHTKLNWAIDPNRGIILAHEMNGESLPLDHGKPLGVVVPGQIGGRSVKRLKRLIVTAGPSKNYYHLHDNKVLPTAISPAEADDLGEKWEDERYAVYDVNIHSAVHVRHTMRGFLSRANTKWCGNMPTVVAADKSRGWKSL